jgi:hypothetical protein
LVDSYGFKADGLIKKTLNVKYKSVNHHIVSYYNLSDVKEGKYRRPLFDHVFDGVRPRDELINQPFKAPILESDEIDPFRDPQQPSSNIGLHDSPQPQMGMHAGNNSLVSHNGNGNINSNSNSNSNSNNSNKTNNNSNNNLAPLNTSYAVHTQPHTSMASNYEFPQVHSYSVQPPSQYMQPQGHFFGLVDSPQMMNSSQMIGNSQMLNNMPMRNNSHTIPQNTITHNAMNRHDSKHGIINNQNTSLDYSPPMLPMSTATDHSGISASSGLPHTLPVEFNTGNNTLHMMSGDQNFPGYEPNYAYTQHPTNSPLTQPSAKRRQTAPAMVMQNMFNSTNSPQFGHMLAGPGLGLYHHDVYGSTPPPVSERGTIHG